MYRAEKAKGGGGGLRGKKGFAIYFPLLILLISKLDSEYQAKCSSACVSQYAKLIWTLKEPIRGQSLVLSWSI